MKSGSHDGWSFCRKKRWKCVHGYVSVVTELRAQSKTWDTNGKGDGGSGSIMEGEEY